MHREQHLAREDKSHRHDARRAILFFQQEVGTQVQIAVFRLVVTGRSFDVLDFVLARQRHAVDGLDPGTLVIRRVGQIHPDRVGMLQIGARVDRYLVEPAVLEYENIDHGCASLLETAQVYPQSPCLSQPV